MSARKTSEPKLSYEQWLAEVETLSVAKDGKSVSTYRSDAMLRRYYDSNNWSPKDVVRGIHFRPFDKEYR